MTDFQACRALLPIFWRDADLSGRIRTCGQNKLNAHLFGTSILLAAHDADCECTEPHLTFTRASSHIFERFAFDTFKS